MPRTGEERSPCRTARWADRVAGTGQGGHGKTWAECGVGGNGNPKAKAPGHSGMRETALGGHTSSTTARALSEAWVSLQAAALHRGVSPLQASAGQGTDQNHRGQRGRLWELGPSPQIPRGPARR